MAARSEENSGGFWPLLNGTGATLALSGITWLPARKNAAPFFSNLPSMRHGRNGSIQRQKEKPFGGSRSASDASYVFVPTSLRKAESKMWFVTSSLWHGNG